MNTKLIYIFTAILIGFSGFCRAAQPTWTSNGFISGSEAVKILPYAYLAADANRVTSKPISGFELVPYSALPTSLQSYYVDSKTNSKTGLTYEVCMFSDKDSGMQARLYKSIDSDTYVLAFAGSDIDTTLRGYQNLATNVAHASGYESNVYKQASEWVKAVIDEYPGARVIATGTSLGGGFAQYATLMNRTQGLVKNQAVVFNDVEAYCFNAPGLTGVQLANVIQANRIPADNPEKPSSMSIKLMNAIARPIITHVYVEGEWVSGYHPGYWFGKQYTVRFYDQSWKGYYTKNHHDAYAVRKSMEKAAGVTTGKDKATLKDEI
jgi:hypothetical protein